jgi:hypothetical protein
MQVLLHLAWLGKASLAAETGIKPKLQKNISAAVGASASHMSSAKWHSGAPPRGMHQHAAKEQWHC